jgi:oxygen-independent coproporphyrinogen-3 oxidase
MRVYTHIPFCETRCTYCPFYKYGSDQDLDSYFEATTQLIQRIYTNEKIQTYHFGGGTPTTLKQRLPELTKIILERFKPEKNYTMTVESNFRNLAPDYIQELKDSGITRISLGVQSFDTIRRRKLGRHLTSSQVLKSIEKSLDLGLIVNVDLLYNTPGQTTEEFISEIKQAASLGVNSMSHYSLTVFEGTLMQKLIAKGRLSELPGKRDLQKAGWEEAEKLGYKMWNIKNFGRPSEHILQGYEPKDMIPLGSGAVGLFGMHQIRVNPDVEKYIEQIKKGKLPYFYKPITKKEWYLKILKALIKQREADLNKLGDKFNIDPQIHKTSLEDLTDSGLITLNSGILGLSNTGVLEWKSVHRKLAKNLE